MKNDNCRNSYCSLFVGLLTACAVDPVTDAEVSVAQQAIVEQPGTERAPNVCEVNAGNWQHLANLAVATAHEMGELNTSRQFALSIWQGYPKVVLSSYGTATCAARGGCPMVEGYLALQDLPNNQFVPQALFNTVEYRNTLVQGYRRQLVQIDQLVTNGRWDALPEDHSTNLIGPDGVSMCGTPAYAFATTRHFRLSLSHNGPIPGRNCIAITEPLDPHDWSKTYLCSVRALGFKWSHQGPIAGMSCVAFGEPQDPVWSDNYLCMPENWGLTFSHSGVPEGKECLALSHPLDPNGWDDNRLCWDPSAPLNHPATLCQEFGLFGGASICGGSNPYIDFSVLESGEGIRMDPTDYTPGNPPTTSTGQCFMSMPVVSTDALEGACCYQNGVYGYLVKYTTIPNAYYCRTS